MAVAYSVNLIIELVIGAWYATSPSHLYLSLLTLMDGRLYLPRDGLELLNGRGIFFGILPTRFEREYEKLMGRSSSMPQFGATDSGRTDSFGSFGQELQSLSSSSRKNTGEEY